MSFHDLPQIRSAEGVLFEARRANPEFCKEPRRDAAGDTHKTVTPPPRRDGTRAPEFSLPLGPHGADFLEIDPETLSVRCGLCAAEKR